MEEGKNHNLNKKAGTLFATKSGLSGFSPGISGYPHPEYSELYPEYPDIHVMFTLFPPTECKNPFKSMNDIMHDA